MRSKSSIKTDEGALSTVAEVLNEAGFATEPRLVPDTNYPWLLAENEYFVLAIAVGRGIEDVLALEEIVTPAFNNVLKDKNLGAKRWDAHLVLFGVDEPPVLGARRAMTMQNDIRSLRRIVAFGISESSDSVRNTLAPFLPLRKLEAQGGDSALDELRQVLVLNGISEQDAKRAVEVFQETGDLDVF